MRSAEMSLPWPYLLKIPSDMKPHGMQPQMRNSVPIEPKPIPNRKVVKRSLQRAQKRASTHGMTWYRGKCMTPQDFLNMGMPALDTSAQTPKAAAITTCHRQNMPKKRLLCMTWNGGGLASHRLDEVKQWLSLQQIHVAVVSETRWTFQSTWSDNGWHHIHSADPSHRGSGVLILIAKKLCRETNLRWSEVIPGRLVHVRLLMPARNIDILGCYQHVFTRDSACKSKRETFWKAFDHHLSQMPHRNTLVILGDMNCSLAESQGVCGTTCFRWQDKLHSGTTHADGGRFLSILKLHGLVALNTWNSKLGPTFTQNGHASRIDFICT
jgi:exonuclease III